MELYKSEDGQIYKVVTGFSISRVLAGKFAKWNGHYGFYVENLAGQVIAAHQGYGDASDSVFVSDLRDLGYDVSVVSERQFEDGNDRKYFVAVAVCGRRAVKAVA